MWFFGFRCYSHLSRTWIGQDRRRLSFVFGGNSAQADSVLDRLLLRSRVWLLWMALYFILGLTLGRLSLRFSEPPAQSDEDFSVTLPMEAPTDSKYNMPTSDLSGSFNAFRSTCQLAIIKGQLYKDLYSPAAEDRPLSQVIASVGVLDEKLQEWKRSIPPEYQPEKAVADGHRSKISPVLLLLHYSYFHCMIAIHRRVVAGGVSTGTDLLEKDDFTSSPASLSNPRVLLSTSLCTKAARASINLTKYLSQDNTPFFG